MTLRQKANFCGGLAIGFGFGAIVFGLSALTSGEPIVWTLFGLHAIVVIAMVVLRWTYVEEEKTQRELEALLKVGRNP